MNTLIRSRTTHSALSRWLYPLISYSLPSLPSHNFTFNIPISSTCASPSPFNPPTSSHLMGFQYMINGFHFYSSQSESDNIPVTKLVDVELAQTGEGIAECELLNWFVEEGDEVEEFQPMCEVQSDKATIQITSRYNGKVAQRLYVPGDIVKVGETLLKMAIQDSQDSTLADSSSSLPADSSSSQSQLFGSEPNKSIDTGALSTPAVRHLAKELGVCLTDVLGTGKDGRILREDVLKMATEKGIIQATANPEDELLSTKEPRRFVQPLFESIEDKGKEVLHHGDKTMLLRGYQRAMVKTMTKAATVPHFHYVEEIKCDTLVKFKEAFRNNTTDPGVKHTYLPILIKALSLAISKYPLLNCCFNEDALEVTLKGAHNIGVAIDTEHGLVVPNIKNVQSLSVLEITKELMMLQKRATTNALTTQDVSDGTITLSNIGAIGGKFGSPLVNSPEVAIIAIGRIQKVPQFEDDGTVVPIPVMTVNIGADHRVLDGATVARFCNEWKKLIEKPELLLLNMR